jgi:hypothetical protein
MLSLVPMAKLVPKLTVSMSIRLTFAALASSEPAFEVVDTVGADDGASCAVAGSVMPPESVAAAIRDAIVVVVVFNGLFMLGLSNEGTRIVRALISHGLWTISE